MIISPTRELAIQIFEVLRKVGRCHNLSAGLVIGGKNLREERERLGRMNILVCTPGRMLQHMDQTAAFEVSNVQILVLDEADRIMDMGFQATVDALVEHLPMERQTLLFSATQTKRVSDLARLSLIDPEYIAVHEAASSATPSTLRQHYVISPLPEKLNTLYSFLRSNVHAKILVFLSSGKQVRFVFETFRRLQPGIPLLQLHGRQKQPARMETTSKFSTAKYSCMFATDVVARGLDFPSVDWVLQVDCPEDADTYIHRVGRTARFERDGRAVLFLDPSEEAGMLKRFQQKKIPVERINVRQKKQQSIKDQLQNMCFKDPELKYLGQKAFISYVRSIYVQRDKEVFQLQRLPLEEFSASLGLPGAPKIKFLKGVDPKALKNAPRIPAGLSDDEDDAHVEANGEGNERSKARVVKTKYDRMFERRNQDVLAPHYSKIVRDDDENESGDDLGDAEEDDEFLTVKRRIGVDNDELAENRASGARHPRDKQLVIPVPGREPLVIDSKRREKLIQSKKKFLKLKGKGTKLVYDDDGEAHEVYELEDEEQFRQRGDPQSQRTKFVEQERSRVVVADLSDKQLAKEKRREKREKRKAREVCAQEDSDDDDGGDDDDDDEEEEEGLNGATPYDDDEGREDDDMDVEVRNGGIPVEIDNDESREPPLKRPKKWFEDDEGQATRRSNKNRRARFADAADEEPTTLEDLEALAQGLLA